MLFCFHGGHTGFEGISGGGTMLKEGKAKAAASFGSAHPSSWQKQLDTVFISSPLPDPLNSSRGLMTFN